MSPHGCVCAKKDGKPRRRSTSNASTSTPLARHTIRSHGSTRRDPCRNTRRNPCHLFDAWNGYHSVALCKEDRALTTFITPWGRYRYMTAPQGYIASGDDYTRRFDEIASDVPNKTKCIDDTILWSDSITAAFHQAVEWLQLCGKGLVTMRTISISCSRHIEVFRPLRLLTGNLCDPILNCSNAFLKCSGRISVYFSFPCEYLNVLHNIITINSITCNSAVPELFKLVTFTLLLSTLKSCVCHYSEKL